MGSLLQQEQLLSNCKGAYSWHSCLISFALTNSLTEKTTQERNGLFGLQSW